jgi:hypothetical protein
VSSLSDNGTLKQDIQVEIKYGMELSLEEKAELRVEQGMERKAEFSVERAVEDAINQKYAASLAAVNIVEVQEVPAVGYAIPPPVQVPVPVTILPVPVQEKKQLTPEELRAFEIAAEMSVVKRAEMNVEHAAEMAVEKNYFSSAEAEANSRTGINPAADVHVPVVATPIQSAAPVAAVAAAVPEAIISPEIEASEDKVDTIYKILQTRKQSKSVQEVKDGSMKPKEHAAFGILKNVGLVIMTVLATTILYNQGNWMDQLM